MNASRFVQSKGLSQGNSSSMVLEGLKLKNVSIKEKLVSWREKRMNDKMTEKASILTNIYDYQPKS